MSRYRIHTKPYLLCWVDAECARGLSVNSGPANLIRPAFLTCAAAMLTNSYQTPSMTGGGSNAATVIINLVQGNLIHITIFIDNIRVNVQSF